MGLVTVMGWADGCHSRVTETTHLDPNNYFVLTLALRRSQAPSSLLANLPITTALRIILVSSCNSLHKVASS